MSRSFHEWTNRASNYASLASYFGFPAVGAGLMTYWSSAISHLGVVTSALVFSTIFVSLAWSVIGFVWLRDRSESRRLARADDCDWGFSVAFAVLNVTTQTDMPCQLSLTITNDKSFPLKVKVLARECKINNILPNCRMPQAQLVAVVGPGKPLGINFEGYGPNTLTLSDVIYGTCEVHIAYGRPQRPFTRKMSLWLDLTIRANMSPHLTESGFQMSFVGCHPVAIGLGRDPVDERYHE